MAIITCQNLSLGYDGREIVHDLNFEVHAGDYLCIVGENGSGKSTLMRTLLGLQPPLSGSVLTGGGLKRRQIGYLPRCGRWFSPAARPGPGASSMAWRTSDWPGKTSIDWGSRR